MEYVEPLQRMIPYEEVHADSRALFAAMRRRHRGPVVLIALARGGWVPTRLLGACFESVGIQAGSLSLSVNYRALGTPKEEAVVAQGLDDKALQMLTRAVDAGAIAWLVDGPYGMGAVAFEGRRYLTEDLGVPASAIKIAALHWVRFERCTPAPWRVAATIPPDAYARQFVEVEKPYIDYPWEHADLDK